MNLFMHWINDDGVEELITAPLDDTILGGLAAVAPASCPWAALLSPRGPSTPTVPLRPPARPHLAAAPPLFHRADGVTRRSTLELASQWGEFQVSEKYFNMSQLVRALEEGRVREMFGVGTAACVSPVGDIVYKGTNLNVPLELGNIGVLGKRVLDTLFDIQYGRVEHDWAVVV